VAPIDVDDDRNTIVESVWSAATRRHEDTRVPLVPDPLCGGPATTTRTVEGLECALCAAHAAEIDAEAASN
jgi:hypothetical protein